MNAGTIAKTEEAKVEYTGKDLPKDLVDKVASLYWTYLPDSAVKPSDDFVFESAEKIIFEFYRENGIDDNYIPGDVERARNSGEKGLEEMADAILQDTIRRFKRQFEH